ncbi:MAG: transcription antitermination factor NusB [Deltaproteobacteria bacterium]
MSQRRKAREIALQILYSLDSVGCACEEVIRDCLNLLDNDNECERNGELSQTVKDFAIFLVRGTWQNCEAIDKLIVDHTDNWSFARIAKTDKAIIRMACFELCYCDDIPNNVSINEAVELAKVYGADNAPSFVNGVLDSIASTVSSDKPKEIKA